MREHLSPEIIYQDYLKGNLNKEKAAESLVSLIEDIDDSTIRKESIEILEKIGYINPNIFNILENYLISDENATIRALTIRNIILNYLENGIEALIWVIRHDNSPIVMQTIFNLLEHIDLIEFESFIIELDTWNQNFSSKLGVVPQEARFFLDLEAYFAKDKKNYEIEANNYRIFQELRNTKNREPWLVINDKHVESLNFNFFNWKFIIDNQEFIPSFSKLNYLDLYFEIIGKYHSYKNNSQIPESIGTLTSLKSLTLAHNNLQNIPNSIGNLILLKELDLSFNNLKQIPQIIGCISSLEVLNLKHNKIKQIPTSMKPFFISLKEFEL